MGVTEVRGRAGVRWVAINEVIPNPLNPRKNDAIKTEEMQQIIMSRGWEIPLTVYQKGKSYVVLSGHRRLYAAKQTGLIKELPVYIVDTPQNHQEEIERIASLQRGQVDWTPYEWGKFTYERWVAWGKPAHKEFAHRLNMHERTVAEYLQVLEYYPRHQIETGLENQIFSMSILAEIVTFIKKVKINKPKLVRDLTEDLVRQTMLKKLQNKLLTRDTIRRSTKDLLHIVSDADLLDFFNTSNMDLQDLLDKYGVFNQPRKTFQGRLISIGMAKKSIGETEIPYSDAELLKLLETLEDLQDIMKRKMKQVKKAVKDRGLIDPNE